VADGRIIPPPGPAYLSAAARAIIEQPIVRTPTPPASDLAAWRRRIAEMNADLAEFVAAPRHLSVRSDLAHPGGVPTWVVAPDEADSDGPIQLDIHGGGLILGAGEVTRIAGEINAANTGIVHWAVDYRMPPDHPFPAALDDLLAVYRALLDVRDPSQIVVGGGSAGGNLAAALLLRAKDEGLPMPAALLLLTPESDLTESGDSFVTLKHVSVGMDESLAEVNKLYADGRDLTDPLLSPLFGDLAGFPPTLLITGTRDLYLSNTVRMHRALRDADVWADLHVFDARPHGGFWGTPDEEPAQAEIRDFIRRRVGLAPERPESIPSRSRRST
jgi:epsilon-lactone hydrolase